jgi:ubiquinone/menaquinone biosynthesis C-methylase UbiE
VGHFFALDLQREMLQRMRRKGATSRLFAIQGDATRLPVADGSIDLVIAITVLGETPSARSTIAEVGRVLRPGGVFSVSEHWPDPDFIPFDLVDGWCREHGLRLEKRYGRRFNYTANFISQSR